MAGFCGSKEVMKTRTRKSTDDHPLIRWAHARGITRAQLAHKIGVDPMSVYFWTSGKEVPRLVHAIKIQDMTDGYITAASWVRKK